MPRYVILSFFFMGLAFYEMSGGADFEPGPNTTADALGLAHFAFPPASADPEPMRASAAPSEPPLSDPDLDITLAKLVPQSAEPTSDVDPDAERLLLAQQAKAEAQANRDLRLVDADRVNLRSGPGTQNAVLTQLAQGEQVEVIGDAGDGWLELRVVESGLTGWMADFLVTASAE